jgi:tetratricopeptide (TPR) repeat protein
LTTASDVYSLASVLYRCVTGEAALDVRNRPLGEAVAIVRDQEPIPAVRRRPECGLDLSRVLDKALRKQPGERYSSMEAFRADLEAYLEGRPVEARGAGFVYRAGKAARRHWLPLVAAVAAIVLVAGSFVSITRSARRAEELRKLAESARGVADQQRQAAEAARQQAEAMRRIAEARTAEAGLEREAAQNRLRSERDFTDVFTRLVDDDFLFGNKDSVRLLDGWIKSQQERLGKEPGDEALRRMTGFLYFRRCVALARANLRSGEADCKAAVGMLEPFVKTGFPDDWVLRSATGANSLLGQIYAGTSRKEEAIVYALRAVELADRFAQSDVRRYGDRLVMRSSLANVYLNANRVDEAIRVQSEAFRVWNARPPGAVITAAMAVTLPATMQRYSQMLMKKDPAKAEQQMGLAIRLLGQLAARKEAGCLEANEYANALNMTPFEMQREPEVALRFAAKAVEVCPADRKALAMDTLAWAHFRKGDAAKEIAIQKQAIESLPPGAAAERFLLQGSLRQFEKAR